MTNTTSSVSPEQVVDRYIASWNELDAGRRAELVARAFTPRAQYVDPLVAGEGHKGIADMIGAVQGKFAGLVFSRRGTPDAHGTFIRFSWSLGPAGGEALAGGTDFGVLDGERLSSVTGFLDFVPPGIVPGR